MACTYPEVIWEPGGDFLNVVTDRLWVLLVREEITFHPPVKVGSASICSGRVAVLLGM